LKSITFFSKFKTIFLNLEKINFLFIQLKKMEEENHECDYIKYKCRICKKVEKFTCTDCLKEYSRLTKKHKCVKLEKSKEDVKIVEKIEYLERNCEKIKIQNDNKEKDTKDLVEKKDFLKKDDEKIKNKNEFQECEKDVYEISVQINDNLEIKTNLVQKIKSPIEFQDVEKMSMRSHRHFLEKNEKMDTPIYFVDKKYQDIFIKNPTSLEKSLQKINTKISIDIDSLKIQSKKNKKLQLACGVIDLELTMKVLKEKYGNVYGILLGTIGGMNICLKFPHSYNADHVWEEYLNCIFGIKKMDLPTSFSDLKHNYPKYSKRSRISAEVFNEVIDFFFETEKEENDFLKSPGFIDEGTDPKIALRFVINGMKGSVQTLENLLMPFDNNKFSISMDLSINLHKKCFCLQVPGFEDFEYQVFDKIYNYHSNNFRWDFNGEQDYVIEKINFYNNIKGLYLGNSKEHLLIKTKGVYPLISIIQNSAQYFEKIKKETQLLIKMINQEIDHSKLRLEFTLFFKDGISFKDEESIFEIVNNLFWEVIDDIIPCVGTVEEIDLSPLEKYIEEMEKEKDFDKLYDLTTKINLFLSGTEPLWKKKDFEGFFEKELQRFKISNNSEYAIVEFNSKYLKITSEKPKKSITFQEYFQEIWKKEKLDFRNIDCSQILHKEDQNYKYNGKVFSIKILKKQKIQKSILDDKNFKLLKEILGKSNFENTIKKLKSLGKEEISKHKKKNFQEWLKPIEESVHFREIQYFTFFSFFRQFEDCLVPSFRHNEKQIKFRPEKDRAYLLSFKDEDKFEIENENQNIINEIKPNYNIEKIKIKEKIVKTIQEDENPKKDVEIDEIKFLEKKINLDDDEYDINLDDDEYDINLDDDEYDEQFNYFDQINNEVKFKDKIQNLEKRNIKNEEDNKIKILENQNILFENEKNFDKKNNEDRIEIDEKNFDKKNNEDIIEIENENQNIINKIKINNINYHITKDAVLFREEEGYLYIYDDDKIDFGSQTEKEKFKSLKKRKLEENSRFKINEKEYKM
jgi:hypothetical protein